MSDVLELLVRWHSGRDARLDVRFLQPRGDGAGAEAPMEEAEEPSLARIEESDVHDKGTFLRFLREATRGSSQVEAICWTVYRDDVYRCLGIGADEPEPVEVMLPDDD
jgi:hypothetical protein